ncbi:LytTR family transcriptional regulator DNA-binding domain-containing protein [Catenovulum sp. SM1970]|uniref:LytTR family DNA-binding domain-containing protein n=1 Tax=Marinifaba aquimaris TaxID=2741323 RepID=UPI001573AD74|nr:LytTR family DNA-binding domain-containing protein [Marinifaba aquimaris]NTS76291.1 LytTR family transcriptional regulator DNA-binding domain-containing protein [Marinifaba aquimaris]
MNRHFRLGDISPLHYFSSIAFVLGCIFTFVSDENQYPFGITFVQWQLQTFSAIGFFVLSHYLIFGRLGRLPEWMRLIIAGFIASLFFTPFSLAIDVYWLGIEGFTLGFLIEEWINMAPPSIFCWFFMNLPWLLGVEFRTQKGKAEQQDSTQLLTPTEHALPIDEKTLTDHESNMNGQTLPHFFNLCELDSLDDLIALKAELHYLSVITAHGQSLILYNLKDAIADLAPFLPSAQDWQTHRSYWVNLKKVEQLDRKGREGTLILESGATALVSRANMAKVRSWLEA